MARRTVTNHVAQPNEHIRKLGSRRAAVSGRGVRQGAVIADVEGVGAARLHPCERGALSGP